MPDKQQQIPLLIPTAARTAQAELFKTLRDADNPAAWMIFMETVTKLLPDVLSSGRPSAEAIARSAIGQLGFKSWAEMIEAPAERNGLAWNQSAWKAWRRAWAVVQANPWLRSQPFTSSEINTLANDCKRDGMDFPRSLDELETTRSAKKGATEDARANSVAALTGKLQDAEKAAQNAQAALAVLRQQLAEAISRERAFSEEIGSLKAQIDVLLSTAVVAEPSPTPVKITWPQRLRALFFGKIG